MLLLSIYLIYSIELVLIVMQDFSLVERGVVSLQHRIH